MAIYNVRGEETKLNNYALGDAEIGLTTDTDKLYVGTGTNGTPVEGMATPRLRIVDERDLQEVEKKIAAEASNSHDRRVLFICPGNVEVGVQDAMVKFPFEGTYQSIEGFLSEKPNADVQLVIERSSDLESWKSITESPIAIKANAHVTGDAIVFAQDGTIASGTYLRVRYLSKTTVGKNLSISLAIQTK